MERRFFATIAATFLALGAGHEARAGFTIDTTSGQPPTGVSFVNFNNLALGNAGGTSGGIAVTFSGGGQAVQGSSPNNYAAPFISNGNGSLFGDPTVSGADSTTYLSTGIGSVTLALPGPEKFFGLLWGSVDSYNSLQFYNAANQLIDTITGSDVNAAANGNQGAGGSLYVNINSTDAFTRVVAVSASNSFEFDNVAFSVNAVPEPASLAMLGIGLATLAFANRRRLVGKHGSAPAH